MNKNLKKGLLALTFSGAAGLATYATISNPNTLKASVPSAIAAGILIGTLRQKGKQGEQKPNVSLSGPAPR